MLITKTNINQRGTKKTTLQKTVRLGQMSSKFVVMGLLAALALLYLTQSTQGATRLIQTRSFENERVRLEKEQERLELEVLRLKSLQEIEKIFPTEPNEQGEVSWEKNKQVTYLEFSQPVAERQP